MERAESERREGREGLVEMRVCKYEGASDRLTVCNRGDRTVES